jgi:predicted dinucleotide-binding enzyme
VIAGDDEGAKAAVTGLIDQFGFDTVGYGRRRTASELCNDLAAAIRPAAS